MTDTEARRLATRIAKQSTGVRVKFGRTNGQPVLHLIRSPVASVTISAEHEWADHAWNTSNRPREAAA